MAQPTKYKWDQFKKNLSGVWGTSYLLCEDYLITIRIEVAKNRTLHYAIYVNGEITGKLIQCVKEDRICDLPEASRRFYMPTKRSVYNAKEIKALEKIYGKRECKKKRIYLKQVLTMPYWRSINSMVSHFKKFNENIEILSNEEGRERLENLTNSDD